MIKIVELEGKLKEAQEKKERAISQAQLTKRGHVYVISNIGSFGEDVFKVGMTRRLEPMDRVRELGDASVPFNFDVHAIIPSEDAPALELKLHEHFRNHQLNRMNARKEFFKVPLNQIEQKCREIGVGLEFTKLAEAKDFRQSLALMMAKDNGTDQVSKKGTLDELLAMSCGEITQRVGKGIHC